MRESFPGVNVVAGFSRRHNNVEVIKSPAVDHRGSRRSRVERRGHGAAGAAEARLAEEPHARHRLRRWHLLHLWRRDRGAADRESGCQRLDPADAGPESKHDPDRRQERRSWHGDDGCGTARMERHRLGGRQEIQQHPRGVPDVRHAISLHHLRKERHYIGRRHGWQAHRGRSACRHLRNVFPADVRRAWHEGHDPQRFGGRHGRSAG